MSDTAPPTLPIRSHRPATTPGGGQSPKKGGASSRHRNSAAKKDRKAWADFTPTPWLDYAPTPWTSTARGMAHGFAKSMETHAESGYGCWPSTPTPTADSWGATPTPSSATSLPHNFGLAPPLLDPAAFATMAHMAAAAAAVAAENAAMLSSDKSPSATADEGFSSSPPWAPGAFLPGVPPLIPSAGSAMHGTGKCKPCAWFWKTTGCQSGLECGYCHLCPEGELKNRKKLKVAAMRMGALQPAKSAERSNAHALKLTSLVDRGPNDAGGQVKIAPAGTATTSERGASDESGATSAWAELGVSIGPALFFGRPAARERSSQACRQGAKQ
eukprot:CAMPEP_0176077296 /NCGR_PEP_ID=MMETSP0120_2-20121206/38647_1 /TAXON_ID=160619 /ORGANISM="Kryptoperidinium foliaceum, Strain CCMP 1326" /LENGTH=328 /DNA_ID=CAMNT_0017411027 /DNA_START=13 /DNA_END=997 /DNA_ORIENTATION=+